MNPKQNDLIRRKDVLAVLEEVFDQYRMSWGEQHGGFAAAVPTAIKNIPTAYDIDKVVEQLEEKIEENPYCSLANYRAGLFEAIEIVKKGGVSDET